MRLAHYIKCSGEVFWRSQEIQPPDTTLSIGARVKKSNEKADPFMRSRAVTRMRIAQELKR